MINNFCINQTFIQFLILSISFDSKTRLNDSQTLTVQKLWGFEIVFNLSIFILKIDVDVQALVVQW
jgi:hypothetical protein